MDSSGPASAEGESAPLPSVAPPVAAPGAPADSAAATSSSEPAHPLQYSWTMWYSKTLSEWNPQPINTFDTVEGFWRLYNNLVPAGSLPAGADYFLFKKGISPAWEDPQNRAGGVWALEFPVNADDAVNHCWLWTLLALIGEYFTASEDIAGAVVSIRTKAVKLSLWVKTAHTAAADGSVPTLLPGGGEGIAREWWEAFASEAGALVNQPTFKAHSDRQ